MKNVSGLEAVFLDYRDRVNFYYVYKRLAHPETNGFVEPATLQERLLHVAEAKRMTGTSVPWLADAMDDRMTKAFGGTYNGEFVIDSDGKVVRQRFWSNPTALRSDLSELVGPVESPTQIEDLAVRFRPQPREIASSVVPRIDLPEGLSPIKVQHIAPGKRPVYVKLRAELTRRPDANGKRKMYLGFYMDRIHRVHWNNGAGPIEVLIDAPADSGVDSTTLKGPTVEQPGDIDARMFLVDVARTSGKPVSLNVTLRYVVCDDAETFCVPITQEFDVSLKPLNNGSTRPGIFLDKIFRNVAKYDKDGDGNITANELGEGNVTMYMTHIDYNLDNVIDRKELDRFNLMYNNGRGINSKFPNDLLLMAFLSHHTVFLYAHENLSSVRRLGVLILAAINDESPECQSA
ncbi:MAG: hypothetical protein WBD20_04405 [Pirellulaceae bacterium]